MTQPSIKPIPYPRADFDFITLNNLLMQADNTPEDNVDLGAYVPGPLPMMLKRSLILNHGLGCAQASLI
jgi:hypothetical protein